MTAPEPVAADAAWRTGRRILAAALWAMSGRRLHLPLERARQLTGRLHQRSVADRLRADMLLRGERPLRDFPDPALRGAGPALGYAVPVWAQQLGGRTLLPEGVPVYEGIPRYVRDNPDTIAQEASQSVPIILVDANRLDADYPLIARYVSSHYRQARG